MNYNDCMIVTSGAIEETPATFKRYWNNRTPILIADQNTWEAAGKALFEIFSRKGYRDTKIFIFDDVEPVYGDDIHIARIRAVLEGNDLVAVAVGSGTINDIVKRASYECGKAYMVVATAPSVDGYTAFGSAIAVEGFKTTLPGNPPVAVIADLDILCKAPYLMIASGYGDLAAKVPAGADWKIADIVGIEPIHRQSWDIVQSPLRTRLSNPEKLALRDPKAIEGLFLGLAQVGYAMQLYQDSRPASGAEHMMSHVWEMEHVKIHGQSPSHGFKVAIGTLAVTAFITEFAALSATQISDACTHAKNISWGEREHQIHQLFSEPKSRAAALEVGKDKFLEGQNLGKRREDIVSNWTAIVQAIEEQIIPFKQLKEMFVSAGCPVQPAEIGLDKESFIRGFYKAQLIRTRYTVFDAAFDCGLFDHMVQSVSSGHTYFESYLKELEKS
jgi:glycerol-1-phosphate dehydrogenase [NAD(P)+]